jgi:hypothetical protein
MLSPFDSDAISWLVDETNAMGADITNNEATTSTMDSRLAVDEFVIRNPL